jgi:hypothetical protein
MKITIRVWLPAVGALVATVLGALYLCKRPVRLKPTYKTIDDIRPPRQIFKGYDESLAQPVTYANNNRARLVMAERPWRPNVREVPPGSVDIPCAASI